jgi:hypothetical protein
MVCWLGIMGCFQQDASLYFKSLICQSNFCSPEGIWLLSGPTVGIVAHNHSVRGRVHGFGFTVVIVTIVWDVYHTVNQWDLMDPSFQLVSGARHEFDSTPCHSMHINPGGR